MKDILNTIGLSGIRAFTEKCQSIEGMVFLTIGEPDLDTPQEVKEALVTSVTDNNTHYPPALGIKDLRDMIVEYENKLEGLTYTTDNVLVTIGATEGLFLSMAAIVEPGDEIIMPTPCFALYDTQIKLLYANTVPMSLETHDFQIRMEYLNKFVTDKTRGIVLASPNNPTGIIYDQESIDTLVKFLQEDSNRYVIMDEVYRDFIYKGDYVSIREYKDILDQVILVQSLSKSKAMTGWRVGYVIANEELIHRMHIIHQNLVTGVPTFIQKASKEALTLDTSYMKKDYAKRLEYVLSRLDSMGMPYINPEGAFYIFLDVKGFNNSSLDFATELAHKHKVSLIPGIYFGTEGYVRLSYCYDMEVLKEGLDRLEAYIK